MTRKRILSRDLLLLMSAAMLIAVGGCGSKGSGKPTAKISGAVTINGEAIPAEADATISFSATKSGQSRSVSVPIVDGKYESPETPVGPVKVYFGVNLATGRMISEAGGNPFAEYKNITPAGATAGLDLVIEDNNPQQDFDLK